jgi:hypothetical protein
VEENKLDYAKMEEQLKEALSKSQEDECPIAFTSMKDESAFFPSDVDGWELVLRSARHVPAHYVHDGKYVRKGAGVVNEVATDEEAQSGGI